MKETAMLLIDLIFSCVLAKKLVAKMKILCSIHHLPNDILPSIVYFRGVFDGKMYSISCFSLSHSVRGVFFMWKTFSHCVNITTIKLDLSLLYPLIQNFVVYVAKTIWLFQSINSMEQFFSSIFFPFSLFFYFHVCVCVCVWAFWLNSIRSIPKLVNCTMHALEKPRHYTHFFRICLQPNKWKMDERTTIWRRCIDFCDCVYKLSLVILYYLNCNVLLHNQFVRFFLSSTAVHYHQCKSHCFGVWTIHWINWTETIETQLAFE